MTENTPDQEPSIEEILASIRQIISDDDEEGGVEVPAEEKEPEPVIETQEDISEDGDVLELTEEMEQTPVDEEIEVAFQDIKQPAFEGEDEDEDEEIEPMTEQGFSEIPSSILSESTQQATMSSLSKLVGSMPLNRRGYDGVTLEDIVRELLNPMLRQWMDQNLPPLVEQIVQRELEKLARRALDE